MNIRFHNVFNWIIQHPVLLIIILSFASRLPQLLSANLLLDGDECIVGLMTKHFYEAKEIPVFFYGQNYGFSFLEELAIIPFYFVFGVSDSAIKLAMLLVWTLGIILFFKTVKNINTSENQWLPLLFTLVFIANPAWAVWSMKARGGYLTAFLLSSLCVMWLVNQGKKRSLIEYFLIGLMTIVIYFSQPLWILGLVPIIFYHFYNQKNIKLLGIFVLGGGVGIFIFNWLKSGENAFWSPHVFNLSNLTFSTIWKLPKVMWQSLTGSYSYITFIKPLFITELLAISFGVIILVLLGFAIYSFFKRKKVNPWFYVLCISVGLTVGANAFTDCQSFRYFLPLSGFSLLAIYVLVLQTSKQNFAHLILTMIILFGVFSMIGFRNFGNEKRKDFNVLMAKLDLENVRYVFSEDGLLQWQIMFYSNEKIIARFRYSTDRYPAYVQQVDDAVNRKDHRIALVGFYNNELNLTSFGYFSINNDYFILTNVSKQDLMKNSFDFQDVKTNE